MLMLINEITSLFQMSAKRKKAARTAGCSSSGRVAVLRKDCPFACPVDQNNAGEPRPNRKARLTELPPGMNPRAAGSTVDPIGSRAANQSTNNKTPTGAEEEESWDSVFGLSGDEFDQ